MRQLTFIGPQQLEWWEVPEPRLEGAVEAIVRPLIVATCDLDRAILRGHASFLGPFPFCHEFIAEVVRVGDEVRDLRPGQRVIVPFQISCGACDYCRRGLTANCSGVPGAPMYGLGAVGGPWGGALSDLVRVPFADAMLVPVPEGIPALAAIASASDNLPDAWLSVAPALREQPGADVLIVASWGSSTSLYAIGMARALGAGSVTYASTDAESLALAASLGATPVPLSGFPKRLGRFPIVVDRTGSAEGLACSLRSTAVGGICTVSVIYWAEATPVPLFEMYNTGVTMRTGRVHARTMIPEVLDLVCSGAFDPVPVTTAVVSWDEAPTALTGQWTKLVMMRE